MAACTASGNLAGWAVASVIMGTPGRRFCRATATPTATPTPTPTPTPVTVSDSIDAITVAGEAGSAPQVTVPTPFAIDETRTRVLAEGAGPEAGATAIVEVNYVGVNARTGETMGSVPVSQWRLVLAALTVGTFLEGIAGAVLVGMS